MCAKKWYCHLKAMVRRNIVHASMNIGISILACGMSGISTRFQIIQIDCPADVVQWGLYRLFSHNFFDFNMCFSVCVEANHLHSTKFLTQLMRQFQTFSFGFSENVTV